jgi:SAM-dependent methyltransferase
MFRDDNSMNDPRDVIRNVVLGEDGIWRTPGNSVVSYPQGGHDTCFGVEDTSFWFAHRNRCIAAVVSRFPPPPTLPVVDVGGGNGYVARMLHGMGHRTILVEPGDSGVRNARARGLPELVQASTDDLDFAPGSVGAIGLFDVIEHIPDDAATLRSFHRLLAPQGRIYATVPAHAWLWSSADVHAGHQRRYTKRGIADLFLGCGFEPSFASYYFWPLPAPMLLKRVLIERMAGRRDNAGRAKSEHGAAGTWIDRLLSWEESRLRRGRTIPMGASCIVVATKTA